MMMNKIIIPTILVATVLIVGIFAFMPIDKVSTVHGTIILNVGGASVTTSDSVTIDDLDDDNVFRQFVLSSDKPYTVHDIEVIGTVDDEGCSSSERIFVSVVSFPAEYGTNVTLAAIDSADENFSNSFDEIVVESTNSEVTQTWSLHSEDRESSVGRDTLTQDTRISVQLEFEEPACGDPNDFAATVKYYLRGVTAEDVDVDVFETEEDFDDVPLSGDDEIDEEDDE